MEYTLESVGIRDTNYAHICALLTLNKKDYMFDGENQTNIYRKDWKKLINRKKILKLHLIYQRDTTLPKVISVWFILELNRKLKLILSI